MKVLINTPDWRKPFKGGVANHFNGLLKYWNHNIKYNIVGSRNKSGTGIFYLAFDVCRFIFLLIVWKPDLVLLNPSLAPNAIRRDSVFLNIASLFNVKVIVFFHGFNLDYANTIEKKYFSKCFSKANSFIVLSDTFKMYLRKWGLKQPVYITTTKVDDRMLDEFSLAVRKGKVKTILILSRIEKAKGIYEAINVFALLKDYYPDLKLHVVGDGSELQNLKAYVDSMNLSNVKFTGALSGKALIDEYMYADLYLFPSYHEGMPTSVLEAMAFGLPVVTRPVGGLVDFFENGKMGEMVDSFEPEDFMWALKHYIENPSLTKEVSIYNYQYAKSHFYASVVVEKMEAIFESVING